VVDTVDQLHEADEQPSIVAAKPVLQQWYHCHLVLASVGDQSLRDLATIGNHNRPGSGTRLGADSLDGLDDIHATGDRAEHDVLAIEPVGLDGAQEELGSVGARTSVGHGEDSRTSVLQLEVLVLELGAVDGLASGAVAGGEVTSLAHEVGDHTVEGGALEAEPLLAGAESTEVLGSLWDNIGPEGHLDATGWSAADGHVEEYFRSFRC